MAKFKCREYRGDSYRFVQAKRDGHYLEVMRNGGVYCFSSQSTELTEQLRHCDWFATLVRRMPNFTTILGELWVPGEPASYVKSAIAKREQLNFDMFAVRYPLHDGADLHDVAVFAQGIGLDTPPWAPHETTPEKHYAAFQEQGILCEGVVFKNGNMLDWAKWKPTCTIDCVVTGFKDGTGKYLGLTGALLVSLEGKEIASVSGMDDETRIMISESEDDYLGRVVEVAYQYVGSNGRLRHPRFVRFRDDKSPEECTLDQLQN